MFLCINVASNREPRNKKAFSSNKHHKKPGKYIKIDFERKLDGFNNKKQNNPPPPPNMTRITQYFF